MNEIARQEAPGRKEDLDPEAQALVERVRERARNLYLSRQMLCAEAVLVALNHGLGGGLSETQAVAMAAPFCIALGESGCLCGALSGAVMGAGLLLGGDHPYRRRRELRDCARQLHDAFKTACGSTCCRVISRKVKHDPKAHFDQCARVTADAAELAARLILKKRPELIRRADEGFLAARQSGIGGALLRLLRFFVPERKVRAGKARPSSSGK